MPPYHQVELALDALTGGRMSLTLLDWRRRTSALYAGIRSADDVVAAHRRWCDVRRDLLRHHVESPIPAGRRAAYDGPRVAPYDPAFRFDVEVDTSTEPRRVVIPTGTDGDVPFDRIGRVHLGDVGTLDVWWLGSYGGGIFVPFRDTTAGATTYAGGRYLLDTVKGADLGGSDGRLVIDFNFAYNPSCAYDPAWACPLAPPGNVLGVPITVGELAGLDGNR